MSTTEVFRTKAKLCQNPRLIHLFEWPNSSNYGVNFMRNRIASVEKDGPAFAAGVKAKDIIVEINSIEIDENGYSLDGRDCITLIKANPNSVMLLTVDEATLKYYKEKNIAINGNMNNIVYKKTPAFSQSSWTHELLSEFVVDTKSNFKQLHEKQNEITAQLKTSMDFILTRIEEMSMENKKGITLQVEKGELKQNDENLDQDDDMGFGLFD